jgi:hypothetical protein
MSKEHLVLVQPCTSCRGSLKNTRRSSSTGLGRPCTTSAGALSGASEAYFRFCRQAGCNVLSQRRLTEKHRKKTRRPPFESTRLLIERDSVATCQHLHWKTSVEGRFRQERQPIVVDFLGPDESRKAEIKIFLHLTQLVKVSPPRFCVSVLYR